MIDLATFNALPVAEAQALFLHCCGATRWVEQMAAQHPFASEGEMLAVASATWRGLARTDWLEAFAAHPRIGDLETLRSKYAGTIGEQAGVAGAAEKTLLALAEGNREYEVRFGHIFIVCASGKTADEMLALLRERLPNDPAAELRIAATEQEKITHLRLQRLFS